MPRNFEEPAKVDEAVTFLKVSTEGLGKRDWAEQRRCFRHPLDGGRPYRSRKDDGVAPWKRTAPGPGDEESHSVNGNANDHDDGQGNCRQAGTRQITDGHRRTR